MSHTNTTTEVSTVTGTTVVGGGTTSVTVGMITGMGGVVRGHGVQM